MYFILKKNRDKVQKGHTFGVTESFLRYHAKNTPIIDMKKP